LCRSPDRARELTGGLQIVMDALGERSCSGRAWHNQVHKELKADRHASLAMTKMEEQFFSYGEIEGNMKDVTGDRILPSIHR